MNRKTHGLYQLYQLFGLIVLQNRIFLFYLMCSQFGGQIDILNDPCHIDGMVIDTDIHQRIIYRRVLLPGI
jgi:hypothetical protein